MLTALFARRYLFSRKSHSVINIISGVSIVALAVPAAAMIILLSVFNGFGELVQSMASTFDADLTVTPAEGTIFARGRLDTASLARTPGVAALSYVIEENAMAEYGGRQAAVRVRGVDERYSETMPIVPTVRTGAYSVRMGDLDRAVLGMGLAYELGIRSLGDERRLALYALRRGSFSTLLPLDGYTRRRMDVAGLFTLDAETEKQYVLTSLRAAGELFDAPDGATALLVRVDPDVDPSRLRDRLQALAGADFRIRTRHEMKPSFYEIISFEKRAIFLISLLVLAVASFSAVGALAMLIVDKRNDAATLRSLGADTAFIRRIFVGEGLLIGAVGGAAGLAVGVTLTLLQQHLGLIRLPVETFVMQSYPVRLTAGDLALTAAVYAAVVGCVAVLTTRIMIPNNHRTI